MNYKIVSDSSSNITKFEGVPFASVPLHIIVGDKSFIDDENVDLETMQETLSQYKGKSSTSCPSPEDWINAFGDADAVFCVTITSALSGSCSSANVAKQMYEDEYPDRHVYIFDSLSTGPEMALIMEKTRELILSGMEHSKIDDEVRQYCKRTHLYFSLACLDNLAKNGRINPIIAKGVGLLGLRIVGKASDEGKLQPLNKGRGDKKAIALLIEYMKSLNYDGGRVIISHSNNLEAVQLLKEQLISTFGKFNGEIHTNTALCTYYAEQQSILVGFEA